MNTPSAPTVAAISDARRFSLDHVETTTLAATADLRVDAICFEAGQTLEERSFAGGSVYRVVEGEAIVTTHGEAGRRIRLGKGKVLTLPAGTAHTIENAGGGLLMLMAVVRIDGAA